MVVMMMSEDDAQQAETLLFHIIYKFLRLIARVYDIAAAFFRIADDITVAFKTSAYKSFYLHFLFSLKNINNFFFILYNKSSTLANFI